MTREEARKQMNLIVQGRNKFELTEEFYRSLDIEVQKELDRNFWRFPNFGKGYKFDEMEEQVKHKLENEEMRIYHSMFA